MSYQVIQVLLLNMGLKCENEFTRLDENLAKMQVCLFGDKETKSIGKIQKIEEDLKSFKVKTNSDLWTLEHKHTERLDCLERWQSSVTKTLNEIFTRITILEKKPDLSSDLNDIRNEVQRRVRTVEENSKIELINHKEEFNDKIKNFELKLEGTSATITSQIDEHHQQIQNLRSNNEKLNEEMGPKTDAIESMSKKIETIELNIQDLKGQLTEKVDSIKYEAFETEFSTKYDALSNQLDSLDSKSQSTESDGKTQLESRIEEFSNEIQEIKSQMTEKLDITKHEAFETEYSKNHDDMTKNLNSLDSKLKSFESENEIQFEAKMENFEQFKTKIEQSFNLKVEEFKTFTKSKFEKIETDVEQDRKSFEANVENLTNLINPDEITNEIRKSDKELIRHISLENEEIAWNTCHQNQLMLHFEPNFKRGANKTDRVFSALKEMTKLSDVSHLVEMITKIEVQNKNRYLLTIVPEKRSDLIETLKKFRTFETMFHFYPVIHKDSRKKKQILGYIMKGINSQKHATGTSACVARYASRASLVIQHGSNTVKEWLTYNEVIRNPNYLKYLTEEDRKIVLQNYSNRTKILI